MCNTVYAKILREPKHGFDIIVYGTEEQAELLIRIAATLAVQGIMCRAVIPVTAPYKEAKYLSEALPQSSFSNTVLIADGLPLPYQDAPLQYPGALSGQLKADALQIASYLARIIRQPS